MGFKLEVGSEVFEMTDFSVIEASTPLAATDSSGQVGTINLSVVRPDAYTPDPREDVISFSPLMLVGKSVRLTDSRKGFTLGRVVSATNPSSAVFTLTCESRLGELNVYNVQAQPFVGTLESAFRNYVALAGVTTDVFVDPSISSRQVVFPGWNGELWFHLKQMAAAQDIDISLVSGVILLRPIRVREAIRGRDVNRTQSIGGTTAQFIELYHYDNQPITDELVYPPGGWSEDVTIIHVNSGEYVEQTLPLEASLSSVQQPVMQTFVSRDHNTSSVFTVVGDDGLPVQPNAWTNYGGRLAVEIAPDTVNLVVKIQAPMGLPNKDGEEIAVYGIALTSDSDSGRYSTLRILGSGVSFNKTVHRVPTGLSEQETGTEVGATVDNPYLSSLDQLYRTGSAAARKFSGRSLEITGTVTAVNKLGDSGVATYPPYSVDQANFQGMTYEDVQLGYAGMTYQQIQDDLFESVQNDFDNQVFGNVNGSRVWDQATHRWYRVREGTLNADLISFSADDDLTYTDYENYWSGSTYADHQTAFNGRTYGEVDIMGMVANG